MLRAEALDEQVLEIAERNAAIDRPPRGEGDDQRVGAAGRAFGPLRCILDPFDARLQFREASVVGRRCRGWGRRRSWRWLSLASA